MKKSDIYEITLKILGLYLFATSVLPAFDRVLTSFAFIDQENGFSGGQSSANWKLFLGISIANIAMLVLMSAFFFFKSKFIVRKICAASDFEEDVKLFAEPKVIYEIALIITGLLLIVWTLPVFGFELKTFYELELENLYKDSFKNNFTGVSGAKILLGIFLVLIEKQLSGYFGKSGEEIE